MTSKTLAILLIMWVSSVSLAQPMVATLRENIPLNQESNDPSPLVDPINNDQRQPRAYPMQPPVIPHQIIGYQLDKNANQCLSCHSRARTAATNAPMVSVTHFMDRDGNFLADVSPRRYFCTQCHVSQIDKKPLVNNSFIDIQVLLHQSNKQ